MQKDDISAWARVAREKVRGRKALNAISNALDRYAEDLFVEGLFPPDEWEEWEEGKAVFPPSYPLSLIPTSWEGWRADLLRGIEIRASRKKGEGNPEAAAELWLIRVMLFGSDESNFDMGLTEDDLLW